MPAAPLPTTTTSYSCPVILEHVIELAGSGATDPAAPNRGAIRRCSAFRGATNWLQTWPKPSAARVPIDPLTDENPTIDVVDAYEIQLINIRQRVAEGARVVGHKVGLSSKAMQQMMGVDEPDYGHLLDEMEVFEDIPVKAGRYLYPRVEVEVGFILGEDLPGADCTEDDVIAATAAYAPSIELIDTRITDWKIKLCDTIADNASSAGFVLGAAAGGAEGYRHQDHRRGAHPQRRSGGQGPQRRRARQPGDRGGVAGAQGGEFWCAATQG